MEQYRILLDQLKLEKNHEDNLLKRGINKELINELGYKTFPYKRANLAQDCAKLFNPMGVPGFWKEKDGKWQLAGMAGLAIPVRDFTGAIQAIKIRTDKTDAYSRYVTLSSNPKPEKGEVKFPNGAAANIAVHYPLLNKDKINKLIITEGELKADITCALWPEYYTISIPGINVWEWAIEAVKSLRPDEIYLAFDADKNKECSSSKPSKTPFIVAKALAKLYMALKENEFNVKIMDWDEQYGKGIDDVLQAGFSDKIKIMSELESSEFCKEKLADEMPLEWIYILKTKKFINIETNQDLDKEQFNDKFCHQFKKIQPSTKALKSPAFPRVDYPIYEPNEPKIINKQGLKYYNFWRPNDLQPAAGDATKFYEHIKYILPKEDEQKFLLDFLAYQVQYPGKKIKWSILLQGNYGIGKSYLKKVMRLLLGSYNVSVPTNDALHEPYTAWAKNCQFIIVEEIMARGRLELMNKLKPMITEEEVSIRDMYSPTYEQPNRFNILMFTNHEDALIVDKGERRYCVLYSPAIPKDESYYKSLFNWTDEHAGVILYEFMNRDLSKFNPNSHAPSTEAKEQLINNSLRPIEFWMKEAIETSSWPFLGDLVSVNHLLECMPKFVKECSPQLVGKTLKKLGAEQLKQIKMSDDRPIRVWCVRNHLRWRNVSAEAIRDEYERWLENRQPESNPLMDSRPY